MYMSTWYVHIYTDILLYEYVIDVYNIIHVDNLMYMFTSCLPSTGLLRYIFKMWLQQKHYKCIEHVGYGLLYDHSGIHGPKWAQWHHGPNDPWGAGFNSGKVANGPLLNKPNGTHAGPEHTWFPWTQRIQAHRGAWSQWSQVRWAPGSILQCPTIQWQRRQSGNGIIMYTRHVLTSSTRAQDHAQNI
jgi:hypothetical protein